MTELIKRHQVEGLDDALAGAGQPDIGIEYADSIDLNAYTVRGDAAIRLNLTEPSHVGSDEATHPSVLHFPEKWNGWHYWMAFTPYVAGSDVTEDPCVAVSQNGIEWRTPDGLSNPLDDAPGGTLYNSDTELAISPDGLTLHLLWRQRDESFVGAEEIVYLRSSTDGVAWTVADKILTTNKATEILASPAVLHDGTQWVMWTVDVAASPNAIRRRTCATIDGVWSAPTACAVTGLPAGRDLWHLSVIKLGNQYVSLLNDCVLNNNGVGGRLYLMGSADQTSWTLTDEVAPSALSTKYDALYRGSLVPTFDNGRLEFRMWYGAWKSGVTPRWGVYFARLTPTSVVAAPSAAVDVTYVNTASGLAAANVQAALDELAAEKTDTTHTHAGGGSGELLMQDGVTAPPVPIETEARDDWLYAG